MSEEHLALQIFGKADPEMTQEDPKLDLLEFWLKIHFVCDSLPKWFIAVDNDICPSMILPVCFIKEFGWFQIVLRAK